jgi:hypothetical protein
MKVSPFHADPVADVEEVGEQRVGFVTDITLVQVALDAARHVRDVERKTTLPPNAMVRSSSLWRRERMRPWRETRT